MFQSGLSIKRVFAEIDSFGKWAFQSQTKDIMLKEWHRRSLSEAIGKKLTGNAAYKLGFSRLQSYSTCSAERQLSDFVLLPFLINFLRCRCVQ
jgi:hypothetical protein